MEKEPVNKQMENVAISNQPGIENKKKAKKKPFKERFKTNLPLLVFSLPAFIWFVIFAYLPMFGLIIPFKRYKIFSKNFFYNLYMSEWSGLDNFKFFFRSNDAWIIIRNTIGYNFIFIVVNIVLAMFTAIALHEIFSKKLAKFYQTSMFLPHFLSWVVISYAVFAFLSPDKGLLNKLITSLGGKGVNWYTNTKFWPVFLVLINSWKGLGYNTVVYLSALSGIDKTYYEAAAMDGATKWQMTKSITIPLLRPVVTIIFITSLANIFRADFGLFFQVPRNSGPLYNVTNVIDTYVFRALLESGDIGLSSAVSLLQSVVGTILILFSNKIVKRYDPQRSLF